MKVLLYTVVALFVSAGLFMWKSSSTVQQPIEVKQQHVKGEEIARKHFRDDIESARKDNRKEIVLPSANEVLTQIPTMSDIVNNYSLLHIKVIAKEVIVSEPSVDINTWYKCIILETIHKQSSVDEEPLPEEEIPNNILPLLPSEILLVVSGGEVTIDGIRVIRSLPGKQFTLAKDKEYLIAGYLDFGGKFIRPAAKSASVFAISNSTFTSLGAKNHEFVREVEELYGNDMDRLRVDIRQRQKHKK